MASTKTRGKRDNPYVLDDLFVTVHRSIAGTAWRWRTELLVLAGLLAALAWLSGQVTFIWAIVVLAAAMAAIFTIPVSRRFIIRRFWCVLARHRVHRLCFEARLHTRAGRVPAVLRARPTKVGERLTIWCRAGTSAEDFAQHKDQLRAACYARDVRITPHVRWGQLVTVDIIRRDTLAASHQVKSPLQGLTTAAPLPYGDDRPAWPDLAPDSTEPFTT
jgi:hypothetical protein